MHYHARPSMAVPYQKVRSAILHELMVGRSIIGYNQSLQLIPASWRVVVSYTTLTSGASAFPIAPTFPHHLLLNVFNEKHAMSSRNNAYSHSCHTPDPWEKRYGALRVNIPV
jgi:hypothetical protein